LLVSFELTVGLQTGSVPASTDVVPRTVVVATGATALKATESMVSAAWAAAAKRWPTTSMMIMGRRVDFERCEFMVLPPPAETENTPNLPHHKIEALLVRCGGLR
jgi:hypothetical protein